jgi:hypothetical protein
MDQKRPSIRRSTNVLIAVAALLTACFCFNVGWSEARPLSPQPYVPIDCWYSVKPMPAQTAAMIQKRSMILVSDQAISSK